MRVGLSCSRGICSVISAFQLLVFSLAWPWEVLVGCHCGGCWPWAITGKDHLTGGCPGVRGYRADAARSMSGRNCRLSRWNYLLRTTGATKGALSVRLSSVLFASFLPRTNALIVDNGRMRGGLNRTTETRYNFATFERAKISLIFRVS